MNIDNGKGNVVRTMFREIDADIYVMVDGDDTYPAEEVHKLIEPVVNGEADMAIGDRLTNGTYKQENKRHFHEFGNNLVKKSINIAFHTKLKDIMTGYRVFNKFFVKNMPVLSPKFEIETEMSLHALDKKFIIKEIPIVYRDRPEGSSSKLNTVRWGFSINFSYNWTSYWNSSNSRICKNSLHHKNSVSSFSNRNYVIFIYYVPISFGA